MRPSVGRCRGAYSGSSFEGRQPRRENKNRAEEDVRGDHDATHAVVAEATVGKPAQDADSYAEQEHGAADAGQQHEPAAAKPGGPAVHEPVRDRRPS
jgi:hypothetical protein